MTGQAHRMLTQVANTSLTLTESDSQVFAPTGSASFNGPSVTPDAV